MNSKMANLKPVANGLTSESWCHTERKLKRFAFKWTIDNFLECPEEEGECLTSSSFPADSEFHWKLWIYPRGKNSKSKKDYVAIYLNLDSTKAHTAFLTGSKPNSGSCKAFHSSSILSKPPPVYVKLKCSILDENMMEKKAKNSPVVRSCVGSFLGWADFVSRKALSDKASGLLCDDHLIIYCEVEVMAETVISSGLDSSLFKVPSNSSNQLADKSWCHTKKRKTRKASFRWKIDNFMEFQEEKGCFLTSSTFSAGNNKSKFALEIYPKGNSSQEAEGHVSLFLVPSQADQSVYGKFKFCILGEKDREINIVEGEIKKSAKQWGKIQFVSRDSLSNKANGLLPDDHLLVSCVVEVLSEPVTTSGHESTLNEDPFYSLSYDLGGLLESQEMSDVTLTSADGFEFKTHKVILGARSPVFAAMFQHDMIENLQNKVEIVDIGTEVLQEMLQCIYTGKISDIEYVVQDLLAASDKYAFYGLQKMCEKHMMTEVSVDNAAEFLILADSYKSDQLKSKVIDFIEKNAKDVVQTDGWKALIEMHPNIICEIMKCPEVIASSTPSSALEDLDYSLSSDFGSLFKSGTLSDVSLRSVDDHEFLAHEAILRARSPVLATMLQDMKGSAVLQDMEGNQQNKIKLRLPDLTKEVLQGMLQYIYTAKVPDIGGIVEDLLVAANKYALDCLKNICEKFMVKMLSVDRAAEFLILADTHRAYWLKSKVIDFLKSSGKEVMKTNGWKVFIEKNPKILLEILKDPEVSSSLLVSRDKDSQSSGSLPSQASGRNKKARRQDYLEYLLDEVFGNDTSIIDHLLEH